MIEQWQPPKEKGDAQYQQEKLLITQKQLFAATLSVASAIGAIVFPEALAGVVIGGIAFRQQQKEDLKAWDRFKNRELDQTIDNVVYGTPIRRRN